MTDPWRYACPECGSVWLSHRVGNEAKKVTCHDHRLAPASTERVYADNWYCNGCGASFDRRYDKKTGDLEIPQDDTQ